MADLSLTVTSDPTKLATVRHAVEEFTSQCGFDPKSVGEVGLVVNEAMANIIRHAYHAAKDRPIRLEASFGQGELRIDLRDWGNGADPSKRPPKNDPLTPGGLGLVCMRKIMDEIKFSPQPDGMLLSMVKRRISGQKGISSQ